MTLPRFFKKTKDLTLETPKRYPSACRKQSCHFFKYRNDAEYCAKNKKMLKEQLTDILLILSNFLSGACLFVLLHSHLISVFSPWLLLVAVPFALLGGRIIYNNVSREDSPPSTPAVRKK